MNSKNDYQKKYNKLWSGKWRMLTAIGPSCQTRFRIMMNIINKYQVKNNILDIGCGEGIFLQILSKNGFKNLAGSDISDISLKLTRDLGIENVFISDICDLKTFPQQKYNTIICSEVLEHIDNDKLAINNLFNLLEAKGKIIISVPYSMKYWSKHDEFSGHFRRYEKNEIECKLKQNGFKIIESFIWGAFFYNIYYKFLERIEPEKVMNLIDANNKKIFKRIISRILFYLFKCDDFLIFTKNGRRIFILAEKIE